LWACWARADLSIAGACEQKPKTMYLTTVARHINKGNAPSRKGRSVGERKFMAWKLEPIDDRSAAGGPVRPEGADRVESADAATPQAAAPVLSVIIPVFNERDTLTEILRRVRAAPMAKEIVIVDDGSTDGTRALLAAMTGEPDLRILYHAENRGKGAALKSGFLAATGDIVLVQDADLEYDPADYPALLAPILARQADVVFGSRFLTSDARRVQSYWHALGNRALTWLSNFFTGLRLTDMETCYKVFRKEVIRAIAPGLKQDRFGIEPELTAKVARGKYRLVEIAVRYHARSYREGKKIGWRDAVNAVCCIVRYWRRD
jgi:glycosyltransferase involved in cell wall biosynthesis